MERTFALIGSVLALLAVALGAFGAHGLQGRVSPADLEIFETGARYHMYHALGLLFVSWAVTRWPGGSIQLAGWFLVAGVLVFSGSLYLLVLTGQRWLGAVTPLGGVSLIVGWGLLAWRVFRG